MAEQNVALVRRDTGQIIEQDAQPLMVGAEYVVQQKQSLARLQQLVGEVLVKDRDFGHIPGIAGETLFDPGASLIIGAFNCHVGERRIISLVQGNGVVSVVLEAPIVSNGTGQVVGSGIGAASTYETKNKYRWEENPRQFGYDDADIDKMETRQRGERTQFKILNPEPEELLSLVVAMASKRAEVDSAKGLPGVNSVLKDLFEKRNPQQFTGQASTAQQRRQTATGRTDYTSWWVITRQFGLTPAATHELLGTKSLTELGDITDDEFKKKLVAAMDAKGIKPPDNTTDKTGQTTGQTTVKPLIDVSKFTTLKQVWEAAGHLFGYKPGECIKILGYAREADVIETPADCFLRLRNEHDSQPPEEK